MPNSEDTQDRDLGLFQGRPIVVINEDDGNYVHYHGVVIGPPGMTYGQALEALDAAFLTAIAKTPDYTYDEVHDAFQKAGFELIDAAVWDESLVNRPADDSDDEDDDFHDEPTVLELNLEPGQTVWVRDNATGLFHEGKFDAQPLPNVYTFTDCAFKWCVRADLRTDRPPSAEIAEIAEG